MTANWSRPMAAAVKPASSGLAAFVISALLSACASGPMPTLANGAGGVMSAHDTAHTQLAGKTDSEHSGKAHARDARNPEAALALCPQTAGAG